MALLYISPPDLSTILEQNPATILLIDVRDVKMFDKEAIASSIHFNLLQCNKLTKRVVATPMDDEYVSPHEALQLFRHRSLCDIVVVNESGYVDERLKEFVRLLEMGQEHHKKVSILFGGYQTYYTLFPALCYGSPQEDLYQLNLFTKKLKENSPTSILPYLFCGAVSSAQDQRILDLLGIGCLINTARDLRSESYLYPTYLDCGLDEFPGSNLTSVFKKANRFIDSAKSSGDKVLVFGEKGITRSCMFVCAYLMNYNKWTVEKAYYYVQEKLPTISLNIITLKRLLEYEKALEIHYGGEGEGESVKRECEELVYLRRKHLAEEKEERADVDNASGYNNELEDYVEEDLR